MKSPSLPHRAQTLAALSASALLAACGVGLSVGVGGGYDDFPPSVSLATAQTSVRAGQGLRVVAAAADEDGIYDVAFYRLDTGAWVLVATDSSDPYEALVAVPADGRTEVSVFARARDGSGREADSAVVSVPVTP